MTPGVEAALAIAEEYGLTGIQPIVLQDTNNTVVWLTPHPVVAKVATGKQTQPSVVREHDVCRHLAACDAPIRHPWSDAPVRIHERTGYVVSLWEYLEDSDDEITASATAETLKEVHRALATYPGPLPSFRDALAAAAEALRDDQLMRALTKADLAMLRAGFASLLDQLKRSHIHQPAAAWRTSSRQRPVDRSWTALDRLRSGVPRTSRMGSGLSR